MRSASPLRYPGGKWRFAKFFERLISINFNRPPTYIEPYAGGASLALSLLFSETVSDVLLNDLDRPIHAFWHSVLTHTDELIELIEKTPVTPQEWEKQKRIYSHGISASKVKLGFATFFLNRTNHSGILNGGMIGGRNQCGVWKLDARFNRLELVRRIRKIAAYRDRIRLSNRDAEEVVDTHGSHRTNLLYLDPPYFHAGHRLYFNAYRHEDHVSVRNRVLKLRCNWVVSYDNCAEIRNLYRAQKSRSIILLHTARTARQGKEVMFFSPRLKIPRSLVTTSRSIVR